MQPPAVDPLAEKAQEIEKADDESTQQKWANVRKDAIEYLSEKKKRWERLQDDRSHRLKEVAIYVVFVVLVTIVALTSRNTEDAFWLSSGLRGYIQDSEFPPNNISNTEKTFSSITTVAHLTMYLQGVVTDCYYSGNGHEPYYPDGCDPSTTACDASKAMLLPIEGNNIIIGNVRIRQLRVKPVVAGTSGCNVPDMIKDLGEVKCYFDYSSSHEDTDFLADVYSNFKANNGREPDAKEMSWMNFTKHTSSANAFSALDLSYKNGGYIINLPADPHSGRKMLNDAIQAGWINQNRTRAVFIEWVLYNPNANLFVFAQGVVEFSQTSSLIPNYKIRVVNLYRWGRATSYVGVVLELVVFAYVSFFFITETREVMRIGIKAYMTDGYALIIITNIVLFIVIIILESILLVRSDAIMKSDMATLKGPEMINVLVMGEKVLSVYAFNALLTWIRMVKYLDIISKKTKVLSDTIAASATDITVFLVLFFVVYFGFCVAFNVAFGSDIQMYKSIKDCLISIFRTMLGDFDYEAMKAANYVLAPLILVVFVIVVSFVLLNMFMAIIMNNYDRVRDELHDDPDDISMHMRRLMSKKMAAWFPMLHRVFGLTQAESDPKTLTLEDCARIWANDSEALEAAGITCPEDMLEVVDDPSLVGGLSLEDIVLFANQRLTGQEEGSEGDEEKEEEASVSDLLRKVLERTNAIVKEQFKVRSMLSGDAK